MITGSYGFLAWMNVALKVYEVQRRFCLLQTSAVHHMITGSYGFLAWMNVALKVYEVQRRF
ncbi:hypothetical protein CP990_28770, partial [Escherichia coli]